MGTPKLIGLCGSIGAGKDTAGAHLFNRYDYLTRSFAAPLKEAARLIFGLEARHVYGTQADKAEMLPNGLTPRTILERLGTDVARGIYENVWVDAAMRDVDMELGRGNRIVFTDVRFPNEAAAIWARGGQLWEIFRRGNLNAETGHESDIAWRALHKDRVISAESGDVEGLAREIDRALQY